MIEKMNQKKDRIVIKIGSSSLTHKETGRVNFRQLEKYVRQISDIKNSGKDVILVSSGAQAVGYGVLNIKDRLEQLAYRQAVASIGQASLIMKYEKIFREYDQKVGQILITKDIIDSPTFKKNAVNTFEALLNLDVIPIVNENDTIATEEIEFGDNDTLSAIVAGLVNADLLILLSDIDGLYECDPRLNPNAKIIKKVTKIDEKIEKMASGAISSVGTGGMKTKIQAAKIANNYGIDMVIANANTDEVLHRIISGEVIGTRFIG